MPPLRLPNKKGKQKQKQTPIDFSSVQSALQSPLDFEGWIEGERALLSQLSQARADNLQRAEGVQQEEQGERYQFGSKAQRHYTNAVIAFRCAASLDPSSFDALYNSARITQQLASDHLPAPECYHALEEAVAGYRHALTLAKTGEERIDALFNLAQACVELQEMGDAGATGKKEVDRLREARQLFAEVERLQTAAMEKVFGSSAGEEEEDEGMDEGEGSTAGSEAGVQMGNATEGRIVTPQLVLDTILEGFEVDLALYSTSGVDSSALAIIAASAHSTLQRAFTLRQQHIAASSPAVDLSLSLAQLSLSSTCSAHLPPTSPLLLTTEAQHSLFTTLLPLHPRNPSLLSSYADHLLDSLSLSDSTTAAQTLQQATQAYSTAYTLLSDRFSPQNDLPAHSIPALLSSNLIARSTLLLLQSHLSPSSSPTLLTEAQNLALQAITITSSGLSITLDPSSGGLSAKASPGRRDWSTIRTLREGWFQLVRVRLRIDGGVEGQPKALTEAWGKATGRQGSMDARWCVEEVFRDDKIWEATGGAEEGMWSALVGL